MGVKEVYQITAPHFCAGLDAEDGIIVKAAPIIGYMADQCWTIKRTKQYVDKKGWKMVKVEHKQ